MDDFGVDDVKYRRTGRSDHPGYTFWMSARDMARFGLLYLRGGRWGDSQIVPAGWVRESTATHVPRIGAHGTMQSGRPKGARRSRHRRAGP